MYNTSNLNSMKRIVYMLAVLFYGTSLFAQDKPFDIEHAPAPLFRCPIYDGIMSGQRTCRNPCKDRALSGLPMCSSIRTLIT